MQNIIWVVAAVLVGLALVRLLTGRAPSGTVAGKLRAGAIVVDVRTSGEYAQGHYPGALHIPLAELGKRMAEIGTRDKPVVLYCYSGGRAMAAKHLLTRAGFSDVVNAGGLKHLPNAKDRGPTGGGGNHE